LLNNSRMPPPTETTICSVGYLKNEQKPEEEIICQQTRQYASQNVYLPSKHLQKQQPATSLQLTLAAASSSWPDRDLTCPRAVQSRELAYLRVVQIITTSSVSVITSYKCWTVKNQGQNVYAQIWNADIQSNPTSSITIFLTLTCYEQTSSKYILLHALVILIF